MRCTNFALSILPCVVVACSVEAPQNSSNPTKVSGKADGVDTDVAESLGSLTITAPSGDKSSAELTYRRAALSIGSAASFAPGTGCLRLSSSFLRVPLDLDCNLVVDAAKPRSVALALLGTSWDKSSVETDFGVAAMVASVSLDGKTIAVTTPEASLVPAGTYGFSFNYGVLGEVQKTVKAGQSVAADLTLPEVRATVTLVPPAERLYPDPKPDSCEMPGRHALVRRRGDPPPGINEPMLWVGSYLFRSTSNTVADSKTFDLTASSTFRLLPLTDKEQPDRYEYVVNNLVQPLVLGPGDHVEIAVKRIDVDDVSTTNSDGTKTKIAGTYEVYRDDAGTWKRLALVGGDWWMGQSCAKIIEGRSSFPTKTGLDVLPGKYKVVVSWSSALGAQTAEHILNLN